MTQDPNSDAIEEEAFDQLIDWLDGPLNTSIERLLKNKILLAACGIGLTTSCSLVSKLRKTPVGPWLPTELFKNLK
jgi:hypothetical protein|tara:strand:+ start:532 stop:759 length:228 start_codon:yes stop_codon:yes gene_type:complete